MLTFYFIRHGTKEAVPVDPQLTPLGMKQAEITAEHLRHTPFRAIIASPKQRTRHTAEILAKPHGISVQTDSRLVERLEWEAEKSFDEFIAEWKKTDIDRDYEPRNGISSNKNGERVENVLTELSEKYPEGNILIVTHGGTIGDMLRRLFAKTAFEYITDTETGATYINILECSVTIVQKTGGTYTLHKLADVSHLSIPLI